MYLHPLCPPDLRYPESAPVPPGLQYKKDTCKVGVEQFRISIHSPYSVLISSRLSSSSPLSKSRPKSLSSPTPAFIILYHSIPNHYIVSLTLLPIYIHSP